MNWNEFTVTTDDGAELSAKMTGEGKPILLIHGAFYDSMYFDGLAESLSESYLVITYDRRGYGKSTQTDLDYKTLDNDDYYELEAEDALTVLVTAFDKLGFAHYDYPEAVVLGSGTGAIVAAYFATDNDEMVEMVYIHEPPLYHAYVPEFTEECNKATEITDIVLKENYADAFDKFVKFYSEATGDEKKCLVGSQEDFNKNVESFLKREYRFAFSPRLTITPLKVLRNRCITFYGEDYSESPLAVCSKRLAQCVVGTTEPMPGKHDGMITNPKEFANRIKKLLDN